MNRIALVPMVALSACTVTVAPIKYNPRPVYVRHSRVVKVVQQPKPTVPPIHEQIHEQYKPLYEKLTPAPTDTPP